MVIKPVEFAMIQQQNNVAKSQYNAENRPMTEQQTITQQVQKDIVPLFIQFAIVP